jgi:hypothetical protein
MILRFHIKDELVCRIKFSLISDLNNKTDTPSRTKAHQRQGFEQEKLGIPCCHSFISLQNTETSDDEAS